MEKKTKWVVVGMFRAMDDTYVPMPKAFVCEDVRKGMEAAENWAVETIQKAFEDVSEDEAAEFRREIREMCERMLRGDEWYAAVFETVEFSIVVAEYGGECDE